MGRGSAPPYPPQAQVRCRRTGGAAYSRPRSTPPRGPATASHLIRALPPSGTPAVYYIYCDALINWENVEKTAIPLFYYAIHYELLMICYLYYAGQYDCCIIKFI